MTATVTPLRRLGDGQSRPRGMPQPEREATNLAVLRDLSNLADGVGALIDRGHTVLSAAVVHGVLVLRLPDHQIDVRRPVRGPVITVAWQPDLARQLDGANIGRRPGPAGMMVYVWQALVGAIPVYWLSAEDEPWSA